MFKRTPGKWKWDFSREPDTFGKPGIFAEGDDSIISPTIGDMELMANAPEMHELLWRVADSLPMYVYFFEALKKIKEYMISLIGDVNAKDSKDYLKTVDMLLALADKGAADIRGEIISLLAHINVENPSGISEALVNSVKETKSKLESR